MTEPAYDCPRYKRCAVNKCPLSIHYKKQLNHPDDKERKCKAPKAQRVAVAANYPGLLEYEGMTGNEFSASKRELPESLRANKGRGFTANSKPNSKIPRCVSEPTRES